MSALVIATTILSIIALLAEVWTILYLCTDSARKLRSIPSFSLALISSNFIRSDDINGVLYSFLIVLIAVPRMLVLYLPKLRPLLLHASILHLLSAAYHFSLSSRIWSGSLGDHFYRYLILALSILFFFRYTTLMLTASKACIAQQEKRAADLRKIRITRQQYEESRQRAAALAEASVLNLG